MELFAMKGMSEERALFDNPLLKSERNNRFRENQRDLTLPDGLKP